MAYSEVAYFAHPQSCLWNFPKKFHSPEIELVDCSISLNQSPIPDNRLVQINSFQELVMQMGSIWPCHLIPLFTLPILLSMFYSYWPAFYVLFILTSFLCLVHITRVPAPGPLHWLFPLWIALPLTVLFQMAISSLYSSQLKCLLLQESFSGYSEESLPSPYS